MQLNSIKIVLVFFYLFFANADVSFGQSSTLRLIEKGKFNKAEKKINKKLKKSPDDVIYNFSKAILLSHQSYNKYNTESAYSVALKVKDLYDRTYDKKDLKDYEEATITRPSINELINTICTKAKDDAINSNNLDLLERYLSYYQDASQVNKLQVETKRNELVFQKVKEVDKIEAYKEFISNYPGAIQVQEAWNRIYELAFSFAKVENTSVAYKKFMSEYPRSTQYKEAFNLYEKQLFLENTEPGNWQSYKSFINNFNNNAWVSVSEDSMLQISKRERDLEALHYCTDYFNGEKWEEALIAYHDVFTIDGEQKTLDQFYALYDDGFLSEYKAFDYEMANLGDSLELHLPYQLYLKPMYDRYIRLSAPNEKAFVAMQRIISPHIKNKDWNSAIAEVKTYEPFFQNQMKKVPKLIGVLEKLLDKSIQVNSVGTTVNTSLANEYSPIISADDKSLFFCGKGRTDNIGGEDIFVSRRAGTKWTNATLVNELSDPIKNNAPLCVSADGYEMLLFDDGDIVSSNKDASGWQAAEKLGSNINTPYWEGDATLTSDGKNLLFVRSEQKFEANYDIVFLIDATGSMQPCIDGVKENIKSFISNLSDDNSKIVNWRAKVIAYRDANIDYKSFEDGYFTSDEQDLHAQLSYVIASGGGDEPESTIESIHRAILESDWSEDDNVAKVIVCFTDASNNDKISSFYKSKKGNIHASDVLKELIKDKSMNLFLYGKEDDDYTTIDEATNAYVTQYYDAVSELQNADYASIMNYLSEKISLLANNVPVYHGDKQLNGDIYLSQRDDNGNWMSAVSIGPQINTPYSERSPFLHPDMKTLYFSSDGHGGLGKLDVYKSTRLYDTCWTCWSEPVNMGKEINTHESDWGYKISTDGEKGYFAKKTQGTNREDIYYVNIPPYLRPGFVATLAGKIVNKQNEPVSTNIRWEDLQNGEIIGQSKSDPTDGSYFIVLPMGKIYGYYVDKNDYFPISNNIDLRDSFKPVAIQENINIVTFKEMIDEGIAVPINNLFFDFGKYNLLPYSIPELKRIAKIIKTYNLKVEIAGHTDNVGDDKRNLALSEQRANSVKDFLMSEGCDASILSIMGYGESKPKFSNDTEKNRALNRRVELKFVK